MSDDLGNNMANMVGVAVTGVVGLKMLDMVDRMATNGSRTRTRKRTTRKRANRR